MAQTIRFDADAVGNRKVNQTTVPAFDVSNVWRSPWVSVTEERRLTGVVNMDKAAAPSGVVIEQSFNPTQPPDGGGGDAYADTWDYAQPGVGADVQQTNPATGATHYSDCFSAERVGLWARLVVKHAGVAPGAFKAVLIGAGVT